MQKVFCKNAAHFHFSVAVAQYLCFEPYSLGRAFYSRAGDFKDANAFSVSLAKQECFSFRNFPFKKIALLIFHILESKINNASRKGRKEEKTGMLQTQITMKCRGHSGDSSIFLL